MNIVDVLYEAANDMFCRPSIHLEVVGEEEWDTPHHNSSCQERGVTDTRVVEERELNSDIAIRAGPQTSPQECQECDTSASAGATSLITATVSDCRMGRQKYCKSTDDSSDDEMFSTPPTSLPPPDRVSYYSSYSLKQVTCLLYTSPSPRDATLSRMPSSA